jgi:hypothetical protein
MNRLTLLVLSFAACAQASGAPPLPACAQDPAGIYAALLAQTPRLLQTPAGDSARQIVVVKTTGYRESMAEYFAPQWADTLISLLGIDSTTAEDFVRSNQNEDLFPHPIPGMQHVVLADLAEVSSLFEGVGPAGWERFYARFPNSQGYLIVTQVGISADGTEALVFYGDLKGPRYGMGEFVVLRCNGKEWLVSLRQTTWMS